MGYGSTGKILRVDLTKGITAVEELSEEFYRKYPGGKALALFILLHELPKGTDPLSPENILILASGLITGAPVSTATRFIAASRSPLTGAYGEAEAAGWWGPELKFAGFEAVVIKGKAPKPCYLWIQDGKAELRDAAHLWGRTPLEVQTTIRQELGDNAIRVAQIGPAGEKMVRYACIMNELRHFNARNGMGAVMGSKNLRAVAVRGHQKYLDFAHDRQAVAAIGKSIAGQVKNHPSSFDLNTKGTPALTDGLHAGGMLPTKNFRRGSFEEGLENLKLDSYRKILIGNKTCYACAIRCKQEVEVNDRYQVSSNYGGPEYESIGALGPDCMVTDLQAVAKANELCNTYGLDTISTGATIAFAMECFEKGLMTTKDTGGIDLRFGDADAVLKMIEMIGKREGFGNVLAEGSFRVSKKMGGEALKLSMQAKGQEFPMHEPRVKVSLSMMYAVSEIGADHVASIQDPLLANPESVTYKGAQKWGWDTPIPVRELSPRKAEQYYYFERLIGFEKSVGFCYFGPAPRSFIQADELVDLFRSATGWDMTKEEILQIGERTTNMARLFNLREGFSRKDDDLPARMFEPLESGAQKGAALSREEFVAAMDHLYTIKGWDPQTTIPGKAKLKELDIEWAAELAGVRPK